MAAFCGLNQLLVLNLANNKLTFAPHLCSVKCSLETLDLSSNKISTLRGNYFKCFKKLKKIFLVYNNIIQLPDLHWVQHSLYQIRVGSNYLTSLSAFQTVGTFKHLHHIELAENTFVRFDVTLLRHMPKLSLLELYMNEITCVDDFRSFYDGKISLNGNPLHCGAALSWLGEEDMKFERHLVCAAPVCLRDMTIAKMSKLSKTHRLCMLKLGQNDQPFCWRNLQIYRFSFYLFFEGVRGMLCNPIPIASNLFPLA